MENNFISALLATVLTVVLLLSLMSASLVQVALETKKYKIINGFIIAALAVALFFSLGWLMYPASQRGPQPNDITRMDVPSDLLGEPTSK